MSSDTFSLTVRLGTRQFSVDVPSTATVLDFQQLLQDRTNVPIAGQKLLLSGIKRDRLLPGAVLRDIGVKHGTQVLLVGTPAEASSPEGNPKTKLHKYTPVSRTVCKDNESFQCSFGAGYCHQEALVCRTCIDRGDARTQHVLCSACATICHDGHEMESWGERFCMKCDCCTDASRNPCQFVVDETSKELIPVKLPLNRHNRYPRFHDSWCYCKTKTNVDFFAGEGNSKEESEEGHEEDEEFCEESGSEDFADFDEGVTCALCNHCFWATHITKLFLEHIKEECCYGSIVGEIASFHCHTCNVDVCPACYIHCHHEHSVGLPSSDSGTADTMWTCRCGGGGSPCTVTKSVSVEQQHYAQQLQVPPDVARRIMVYDTFSRFVCGWCMQENPWLMLPIDQCKKIFDISASRPPPQPIMCDVQLRTPENATPGECYPFQGMLVNLESYAEGMCKCDFCKDFHASNFPCILEQDAPELMSVASSGSRGMSFRSCFGCKKAVDEEEMSYFCPTCLVEGTSLNPFYFCGACMEAHKRGNASVHALAHDLVEDNFENYWNALGAAVVSSMDAPTQRWISEHWASQGATVANFIRDRGVDILNSSTITRNRLSGKRLRGDDDDAETDAKDREPKPR